MSYLFFANGIVSFLISIILVVNFFKHYKKDLKEIVGIFSVLFFVYFSLLVFFIGWAFSYFNYDSYDFMFLFALAMFVQTIVLYAAFYLLSHRKKILHWLWFYLIVLFSVYISVSYVPVVSLVVSFLLSLVLFFNFYSLSYIFRNISYVGIFYSGISVLFQFLNLFGVGSEIVFSLISSFLFLIFVYMFFGVVKKYPVGHGEKIMLEKEHGLIVFLKYFIFMIVLTNLVLVATVGFHEFSHVLVSRYYGCESRTIAYEAGSYPYSEIVCSDLTHKDAIALAGPLAVLIVAVLLFVVGGRYMRPISLLIAGFNLLASYRDFQEVGISQNLTVASSIVGMIFLFFGIVFLARGRMGEHRDFI